MSLRFPPIEIAVAPKLEPKDRGLVKFVIVTPLGTSFLKLIIWPLKWIGALSINLFENTLKEAPAERVLRSADSSNTAIGTPWEKVAGSTVVERSHPRLPEHVRQLLLVDLLLLQLLRHDLRHDCECVRLVLVLEQLLFQVLDA